MLAVKTRGIAESRAPLQRLAERLSHLEWFWAEVVEAFTSREQRWFASSGDGGWPPLSPTYAAWKATVAPGQPLLVLSGDMRDQLTSPEKTVLFTSPRMIILGSSLPYAGYHHTGTATMPKRDPLIPGERLAGGILVRMKESLRLISEGGMGI